MLKAHPAPHHFVHDQCLAVAEPHEDWDILIGDGPVIATAIHDGHAMRPSLHPHLALSAADRRREEDPLTGVLTAVGDVRVRVDSSRFQVDLNRPRDKAVANDPADTWGLQVWHDRLPDDERERSLAGHDRFYAMVTELIERMLERWDALLLIDIHSYNHRRDGVDAAPAQQTDNPDIELGVTTLDPDRWGDVAERFAQLLRQRPISGRNPDVAGLDIVGDKMMEVNVDTPGGINMAEELTGADFSGHIIGDLERKVRLRDQYKRTLSNTELAMM